ncbi:response regulator [Paenibacillus apis]|uniref:AraC family transcriptional regulator n=1 Tax=Paenibacillus apis TaxID=1792174 RepID=A0A919Y585_9BACL|nr:response regulator [Paenibacillus apis]GIO44867.1 AraC family transcriptional regulator [Paenibacillus apis]
MEGGEVKYRVILVDDEPIILRSLKVAIPWEELNLEIVGEARNGEEALRLVREHAPHMIISDIRMPGLDGISLMKEVMAESAKRLFIFISGYSEFEYAREALREGAFDYLLKPIDHDELIVMIQRAIKKLNKQEENEHLLHSAQVLSELARERMFAELIEEGESGSHLRHMQWLESGKLQEGYFVAVVQLDHYLKLADMWPPHERRLWLFAIRNILNEWSLSQGALTVFPFHSGEWIILFPGGLLTNREQLGQDLISQIKLHTKLPCSIGFSPLAAGITQLGEAYQQAGKALYQRFYRDSEGVFVEELGRAGGQSADTAKYPKHLEEQMLECIRTLDDQRLMRLLEETRDFIEGHAVARESAQRMLVELTVVLYREFEHMKLPLEWSLEGLLQELHASETLPDIIDLLSRIFGEGISASKLSEPKEQIHRLIEKTREYIASHYHKDLSIEEAAEFAGLSISHFCLLFKQETGYTFLEYLTECRIGKAKYILKNSQVKVYQIAPLVGYQDPRYFTQVFKKMTGMTPSEYRESSSRDE